MKKRSTSSANNTSKKVSKGRKTYKAAPSPECENITGLAVFPDELLLEIISYYPDSEFDPDEECSKQIEDANARLARRERLTALSQTCRNLHRFLHPYVWSRIEVFGGMRVGGPTGTPTTLFGEDELAVELIRQLEIVTVRDPGLAGYINVVNVAIKSHCIRRVLRELARCIAMFPNLHTLMIKMSNNAMTPLALDLTINSSFGPYESFPQIRSIIIQQECNALLKYMSGARYIRFETSGAYYHMSDQQLRALDFATCVPLLEDLCVFLPSHMELPTPPHVTHQFPKLRHLTLKFIDGGYDLHGVLENCLHLKSVKVLIAEVPLDMEIWEKLVSAVKETLLSLQENDKEEKTIVLDERQHGQPESIIALPWPPEFPLLAVH
ncbi:hypothetical protein M413DRAFT_27563 [Hebeloma cylindrosporum]|uniref:Uncharacterized protein n=1 Tax=Hebeloma cylindrosporum TaxID=76867 RepID=A0A0C3CEH2_HEBCY|nr:hypothetical protein M413DRAFT_27563 [Hebeloma cylindrosporum h7]